MIIIGAGGLAKEVLDLIDGKYPNIAFFDNVNTHSSLIFQKFPIIHLEIELIHFFKKNGLEFCLGLGGPENRRNLSDYIISLGGKLTSLISERAIVGNYEVSIGTGTTIFPFATISNSVTIGQGCLIYFGCSITHDCVIGDFTEISPGAKILGRSRVGNSVKIGANATIFPDITIGDGAIVGAGAVVRENVPANHTVIGVPAKRLRKL